MDYQALKALIQTHPNWPSVDTTTLVTWVNEKTETEDLDRVPATTILEAIYNNEAEWDALPTGNKNKVIEILRIASGEGVPTNPGNPLRAILVSILGNQTKQDLANKIARSISRAEKAKVGDSIRPGDIEFAREL